MPAVGGVPVGKIEAVEARTNITYFSGVARVTVIVEHMWHAVCVCVFV